MWSAPITAGGGTRPTITVKTTATARHRRGRARVLGPVDRGRHGRRRPAQDRDRARPARRPTPSSSGATGAEHRGRRAGDRLLRRLRLRRRAGRRHRLHDAHQRLADQRHGAAGPGPGARHAARARRTRSTTPAASTPWLAATVVFKGALAGASGGTSAAALTAQLATTRSLKRVYTFDVPALTHPLGVGVAQLCPLTAWSTQLWLPAANPSSGITWTGFNSLAAQRRRVEARRRSDAATRRRSARRRTPSSRS